MTLNFKSPERHSITLTFIKITKITVNTILTFINMTKGITFFVYFLSGSNLLSSAEIILLSGKPPCSYTFKIDKFSWRFITKLYYGYGNINNT